MFDWLRKATQSAEISRQERVLDYVDETLSAEARKRFEAELSADVDLQREVAELRTVKAALNALPRQPVPRNFTLDPAKYSKPARAWDAQLYPAMRMATALSAIMFLIVASLTFLPSGSGGGFASAPSMMESAEVAMVEESFEMADAVVEEAESDSAEFESAASSARVADDTMDESAEDSAEVTEMVEEESAEVALAPQSAAETMSDNEASSDMADEPASDAAASSGVAPEPEIPLELQATPTAMPAPTPTAEVFKAAPPLEESVPEEIVVEAISAEPAAETIGSATDVSDTVGAPVDNAAATGGAATDNQSSPVRSILLWAIALLGLFLLLLFLTLRTRARL